MNLLNKISLLPLFLLTSIASQARIPSEAFFAIFDYFKPGYEFYSPALGQIAIENGFIENLRFFGNINRKYEKTGRENEQRSYAKDQGNDALSKLLIKLFPSDGGALTVISEGQGNFGKYVNNPRIVSLLLNYAASCRQAPAECKNEQWKKNIIEITGKLHKNAEKSLDEIIENIPQSIKEEETSIYPSHITEIAILSFFFEKFNSKNDIFDMLLKLNNSIVDKRKVYLDHERYLNSPKEFMLTQEKADMLWKKDVDKLTLSDIISLYNSSIYYTHTPYKPKASLLSNAQACAYSRTAGGGGKRLTNTFADCVEMAGRHLMNLLLYNSKTKTFDLGHLNNLMKDVSPAHPYFNFLKFYRTQTPALANAGDLEIRSLWNEVVGDLGRSNPETDVIYCKPREQQCFYELEAGYINFVNVFAKIFALDLEPLRKDWKLEDGKAWLEKSLKALFQATNPERNYALDLGGITTKSIGYGDSIRTELSGILPITVTDTENNSLFSFDFFINAGGHGEIQNLVSYGGIDREVPDINNLAPAILRYPRLEALSLLMKNQAETYPTNFLYRLFKNSLSDNNSKIAFLNTLVSESSRINKYNEIALSTMLANVLKDISWDDSHVLKQVSLAILELIKLDTFKEVLYENVQGLNLDYDFPMNTVSLKGLGKLRTLDLSESRIERIEGLNDLAELTELKLNNMRIRTLSLARLDKLRTLELGFSPIEELEGLNDLHELIHLDLFDTKLTKVSLVGLGKLKTLHLGHSAIEQVEGLNDLSELTELDMSETKLGMVSLVGLSNLQTLYLSGPSVELIELKNLSQLTSLELSKVPQLKGLSFVGLNRLKTLKLLGPSVEVIAGLNALSELTELELFDIKLKTVSLAGLGNLKTLYLSAPSMERMEGLNDLSQLTKLTLYDIKLRTVSLAGLGNLKTLYLSAPSMERMEGLNDLSQLTELALVNTSLRTVSIAGLSKLKSLNLSNSVVETIEGLNDLAEPISLDLSHIKRRELSLDGLGKIRELILSSSQIEKITLRNLPDLVTIDLSSTELKELFLERLGKLRFLTLKQSSVEKIEGLNELFELVTLNLDYTRKLSAISLVGLQKLKNLLLHQSSLKGLELRNLPSLKKLNIIRTSLTPDTIKGLDDISKNPDLEIYR